MDLFCDVSDVAYLYLNLIMFHALKLTRDDLSKG
jgi:hypothetical protein